MKFFILVSQITLLFIIILCTIKAFRRRKDITFIFCLGFFQFSYVPICFQYLDLNYFLFFNIDDKDLLFALFYDLFFFIVTVAFLNKIDAKINYRLIKPINLKIILACLIAFYTLNTLESNDIFRGIKFLLISIVLFDYSIRGLLNHKSIVFFILSLGILFVHMQSTVRFASVIIVFIFISLRKSYRQMLAALAIACILAFTSLLTKVISNDGASELPQIISAVRDRLISGDLNNIESLPVFFHSINSAFYPAYGVTFLPSLIVPKLLNPSFSSFSSTYTKTIVGLNNKNLDWSVNLPLQYELYFNFNIIGLLFWILFLIFLQKAFEWTKTHNLKQFFYIQTVIFIFYSTRGDLTFALPPYLIGLSLLPFIYFYEMFAHNYNLKFRWSGKSFKTSSI